MSRRRATRARPVDFGGTGWDWMIIGGGIHGVHIAARLIGEAGVPRDRVCILDPADQLLARWHRCTETTGMSHLRSSAVHHIDTKTGSLKRFATERKIRGRAAFIPPYDRPSLKMFNAHSDRVLRSFGLSELHIQDRARRCTVGPEGVFVETDSGQKLHTRHIVLAIGASEQPNWPAWAPRNSNRVQHIFDTNAEAGRWPSCRPETIAVVGGGISAAQVAIRLAKEGHRVHLLSRHAVRKHQFDSAPGWLGPKHMNAFLRERDFDRRRALINKARHSGSMPPDVLRRLRRAIKRGAVTWSRADVYYVSASPHAVSLYLSPGGELNKLDRVLLATGFCSKRPGGAMIDELIRDLTLPCARCGYPIVDASLRWHERIYVSGPLDELVHGPTARNIAGARRAGDYIVKAARSSKRTTTAR